MKWPLPIHSQQSANIGMWTVNTRIEYDTMSETDEEEERNTSTLPEKSLNTALALLDVKTKQFIDALKSTMMTNNRLMNHTAAPAQPKYRVD